MKTSMLQCLDRRPRTTVILIFICARTEIHTAKRLTTLGRDVLKYILGCMKNAKSVSDQMNQNLPNTECPIVYSFWSRRTFGVLRHIIVGYIFFTKKNCHFGDLNDVYVDVSTGLCVDMCVCV